MEGVDFGWMGAVLMGRGAALRACNIVIVSMGVEVIGLVILNICYWL